MRSPRSIPLLHLLLIALSARLSLAASIISHDDRASGATAINAIPMNQQEGGSQTQAAAKDTAVVHTTGSKDKKYVLTVGTKMVQAFDSKAKADEYFKQPNSSGLKYMYKPSELDSKKSFTKLPTTASSNHPRKGNTDTDDEGRWGGRRRGGGRNRDGPWGGGHGGRRGDGHGRHKGGGHGGRRGEGHGGRRGEGHGGRRGEGHGGRRGEGHGGRRGDGHERHRGEGHGGHRGRNHDGHNGRGHGKHRGGDHTHDGHRSRGHGRHGDRGHRGRRGGDRSKRVRF